MSGPNENGGDGFCDLGETVGDEVGEVLGFVPELGDDDADATELQQHPRCTLARAVFGAFLTSGAVVSCPCGTSEEPSNRCLRAFEAGRLAAIRAEVERLLWQLENTASDAQQTAAREFRWRSGDSPFGLRSSQEMVARDYALARRFVDQAADCRRWLEATR